jgi:hypothetical protein
MASFYFYTDAGLTAPLAGSLDFAQSVDGSTGAVTAILYIGSAASGRTLRAASNPGVDPIVVTIVDAEPLAGSPLSDLTLALEPTFSGRVAGSSLDIGTQVNSGVANAVAIYVRAHDSTGTIGLNNDLSLVVTTCEEI